MKRAALSIVAASSVLLPCTTPTRPDATTDATADGALDALDAIDDVAPITIRPM